MARKTVFGLLAAALAGVAGCDTGPTAPEYLPAGATNVTRLDDRWATFDLTVGGRKRTFLARRAGVHSSVTELRD